MTDYSNKDILELLRMEAETFDLYHKSPNQLYKQRLEVVYQHIFSAIEKQIPNGFKYCEVLGKTTPTYNLWSKPSISSSPSSQRSSMLSLINPNEDRTPRTPVRPSRPSSPSSRQVSSSLSHNSMTSRTPMRTVSPHSRTSPRLVKSSPNTLGGGYDDKYYEMKYYKYKAKMAKLQNK
jgi:hypothetical protein